MDENAEANISTQAIDCRGREKTKLIEKLQQQKTQDRIGNPRSLVAIW